MEVEGQASAAGKKQRLSLLDKPLGSFKGISSETLARGSTSLYVFLLSRNYCSRMYLRELA